MQDLIHIEPLTHDQPQTRRGHERCVALLESATELFLKRGFDAVSLDDIVNHAGGSKASIYKYFLCTRQISQNPYPIRILLS